MELRPGDRFKQLPHDRLAVRRPGIGTAVLPAAKGLAMLPPNVAVCLCGVVYDINAGFVSELLNLGMEHPRSRHSPAFLNYKPTPPLQEPKPLNHRNRPRPATREEWR